MSAHLTKPVKQSELFEAIDAGAGVISAPQEPQPRESPAAPTGQFPSLRILLAEDSLVNQRLAVALLKKHGHAVTVASNGHEAISLWETQPFDMVLMDVQMPIMDGLEATAEIRARESKTGAHMPIIAVTANAMSGDREICLAAGMDGYVSKPIRTDELFEVLRNLMAVKT